MSLKDVIYRLFEPFTTHLFISKASFLMQGSCFNYLICDREKLVTDFAEKVQNYGLKHQEFVRGAEPSTSLL